MSSALPVMAVFDVGKTNKKLLLFSEQYNLVAEETDRIPETTDEDGFPCEDVFALTAWLHEKFAGIRQDRRYEVRAVNFSAYGASFVYLDHNREVIPPLVNYLKPYPAALQNQFYLQYGGTETFPRVTASPVLGNLNSGMQLYRLKQEQPGVFTRVQYALHLPQYLSFSICGALCTDITSIGCHTNLWDFGSNQYHEWVEKEGLLSLFPPITKCDAVAGYTADEIPVGTGMHDSSAALIPYFHSFHDPFILLSTGTWCISLNPFNHAPLTSEELAADCLCYLSYQGMPVKASRLFAGYEHEQQVNRLAAHFEVAEDYYTTVGCNPGLFRKLTAEEDTDMPAIGAGTANLELFARRDLEAFDDYETAYHRLIMDLVKEQVRSTKLVLHNSPVKRIFVDGGFSRNPLYMYLLAAAFPRCEVYAATVPQATALGAALVFHKHWNRGPIPSGMIGMKLHAITPQPSA